MDLMLELMLPEETSKLPLEAEVRTPSPKSHAIEIACRPNTCLGHSAMGSHAQIEHASSDSLDIVSAHAVRPSLGVLSAINCPNSTNATFCRAVNRSPHCSMP